MDEFKQLRMYAFGVMFFSFLSCVFLPLAQYLENFYLDGSSMAYGGGKGKQKVILYLNTERGVVRILFGIAFGLSANAMFQMMAHIWRKRARGIVTLFTVGGNFIAFLLCVSAMVYLSANAALNSFVNCEGAYRFAIAGTVTTGLCSLIGIPYGRLAWLMARPRAVPNSCN